MQTVAALDNFRDNIRSRCEEKGLTHRDLAKKAKVHHVTISRILNGHHSPSIPVAERLAKALGSTLEKILAKTY
jgi:transcriptional regulator with XRE-family HTH domain